MSWDSNATIDWEELGTVLQHMPSEATSMDVHMTFTSPRAPIDGEGEGQDRALLPILGYAFRAQREQASNGNQVISPQAIWVSRNVDAATASLISAMINPGSGSRYSAVAIKAFRSGDGLAGRSSSPMIEFRLTDAAIVFHSITTGGGSGVPIEVFALAYRELEISTAPQQASGLRGAVRSVQMTRG
jgi:type VI protein secretion system component Hcp